MVSAFGAAEGVAQSDVPAPGSITCIRTIYILIQHLRAGLRTHPLAGYQAKSRLHAGAPTPFSSYLIFDRRRRWQLGHAIERRRQQVSGNSVVGHLAVEHLQRNGDEGPESSGIQKAKTVAQPNPDKVSTDVR